jgi:hypothetical protein
VLNEHLTDEQKQHIDQARQKYSNDVLKATADLMAESLGSELVDGEAVQREPVSIFTMLGDFAQELVGLVPDVPTVPAIVAEKVDFRSDGGNSDGGNIRFFLKSQLDSTNPALIATLNKLNGPIADRLRLIQKTSIAGAEIGIPALIDDSKSVKRELAEEGIQADSQGITQAVGGDLAQNLGRMSDRLQARRDRLQKRIDKPDPFIAKQSPEVIERFNRQAEEDIVDIEEELELIDARLSGDSGAAERLEIVKANRLLESEKAGLQETIDSNKEQSGLGGRVPVSALNRIISKAEKDIAKIDKEIEKNNAELERLTPAVDADLTPEQVKEIRETVGFDAKVEKARSFGISDETLAPIIARFQ